MSHLWCVGELPQNCHLDRSMMVLSSCVVERPLYFAWSGNAATGKIQGSLRYGGKERRLRSRWHRIGEIEKNYITLSMKLL